jgi:rubredoxin-NAD+ reductase
MSELLQPTDGRGPWKEFLCRACGLIYNEGEGDLDSGILPGTRFDDIPDDWSCPVCGVRKQDFEPYMPAIFNAAVVPPVSGRHQTGGVVIVGAGIAGWSVAAAIREADAHVPVTIVTHCDGDVYNKPELAIAFSRGQTPATLLRETGADAARRLGIRLLPKTDAIGISPEFKKLRTTRGTLRYDSLVLAAGAKAKLPTGIDPALCWRINSLEAWSSLHSALGGGPKKIAIIGAGMVGCEFAEDLSRAGHEVQLFGITTEPLPGLLPGIVGERVRTGLEGLGVRYRAGVSVAAIQRLPNNSLQIDFLGGESEIVDQVVAAVGVATEPRMVRAAGLDFDGGIVVDPKTLETSAHSVYAIGDCISMNGIACRFIEPIKRQAETIAAAVTKTGQQPYDHRSPVIRLKTKSAPVTIEGLVSPQGEWRQVDSADGELIMEQWQGGLITARLVA